jgi:hypothetical protein
VRRGGVPVDVVRLAAHAAVLVVDERHVNARAPDFGILRIEVGSREGVALGIVMCARLIKQEGVDAVAVPAFGVVVRSNAVAIFVSARGRWASLKGQQERSYLGFPLLSLPSRHCLQCCV